MNIIRNKMENNKMENNKFVNQLHDWHERKLSDEDLEFLSTIRSKEELLDMCVLDRYSKNYDLTNIENDPEYLKQNKDIGYNICISYYRSTNKVKQFLMEFYPMKKEIHIFEDETILPLQNLALETNNPSLQEVVDNLKRLADKYPESINEKYMIDIYEFQDFIGKDVNEAMAFVDNLSEEKVVNFKSFVL